MGSNGCYFVEWKEEYVSQERGKRVVHYFLKDSSGESILTVIGTERSLRHMFYVVADDFLRVCVDEYSMQLGFKWRSRREVVDWLTSLLSKQHLFRDKKSGLIGAQPQNGYMSDYMGRFGRSLQDQCTDTSWSGTAWTCGKQLKHYPSFCRNGINIKVQSFAFIMAKERDGYLAYLEDMYEDRKGMQKVKVRWFHHLKEVKGVVPLRSIHPKEVFITPYAQVLSAECVDGLAIVLTPEHYEQCLDVFPPALMGSVHICFREFKSNRVKPFDLCNLHGYFDQAIFSFLNPDPLAKLDTECHDLADKDDEEFVPWFNEKKGSKRSRSSRGPENTSTHLGPRNTIKGAQIFEDDSAYNSLELSCKKPCFRGNGVLHPCSTNTYRVDEKIEVVSQDSGIRGCWFRCKVVQVSKKLLKIQYDDVLDEEKGGKLEEWIPALRIANADPLSMRFMGRPMVRPAVHNYQQPLTLKVGQAIDAWWNDGWWEGIIADAGSVEDGTLKVYLPGEDLHLTIEKKDLRVSMDWTGIGWVDIESKPDICTVITSSSPNTDLSTIFAAPMDTIPEEIPLLCEEACMSTNKDPIEKEKYALIPCSSHPEIPDFKTCARQAVEQKDDAEHSNPAILLQPNVELSIEENILANANLNQEEKSSATVHLNREANGLAIVDLNIEEDDLANDNPDGDLGEDTQRDTEMDNDTMVDGDQGDNKDYHVAKCKDEISSLDAEGSPCNKLPPRDLEAPVPNSESIEAEPMEAAD